MSLFYKSRSLSSAVLPALHHALVTDPKTLAKQPHEVALDLTKDVQTKVDGQLSVWRVVGAFVLLGLIFFGGIWSQQHSGLTRWADVLFDSFKVGLPAVVGLIIGEGTAKAS